MDVTPARRSPTAAPARPAKVSVNGIEIARGAIARETQNHPAAKPVEAWTAAARALVVRELLLQEARRLGIRAAPMADDDGRRETDEEALVRSLIEHEVQTPEPDEAACRRYYAQNLRRFRSGELSEVSHILIAADPRDSSARNVARDEAAAIIALLTKEPDAFAELARRYSACPSREVGGNLGQIGRGQTVAEFEEALARMRVGCVHPEPVETRYGCHVVRLERQVPGEQLPFDIAYPRIAAFLAERVRHTALRQYVALLAGRADITGIDLPGVRSPLVQ